ncbi:bifunctional [glutamate--ammonia ligase]-adenylyl-L-tyrosine phosphorylase/[glutamate--ammonia-ligase] adenylyltransferase [Gynuella sunshinyii]|uniref:Bifunctional glutamine synthetase adenylyltransferase/adenylyl-removing enzyme n=1 Tax=Gynuella sunshinyii YC6258 TaxID=1445510 RepID=A0A0C5VU51_9GAMM|nr:bifunctional [glutamate--ammonia ligase]-adenylyl-L-tyrosine phosphorylase/[glutamate--ammonia-ligase] adenylyltransferase [Gynuella sunshinyii]AJQ93909.1 glutamine synthetase adenylyltransferase [Gynuella sunshinyii YC6258]
MTEFQTWLDSQTVTVSDTLMSWLNRVWPLSLFVQQQLKAHPDWLDWLQQQLDQPLPPEQQLQRLLADEGDEKAVMKLLRDWRNRYQMLVILKDFNGVLDPEALTAELTRLAETAVNETLIWIEKQFLEKHGTPALCPYSDQPQRLCVVAMGKFGATELNLSSDIDLMFAFPTEGEASGGLSHSEYFIKQSRKLVQLLDTQTADGFVYRVDIRLRPWGQSGPVAANFNFMRNYYREQGRDWERYALIKARVVAGDEQASVQLMQVFNEFVYRRYVDFQALTALRSMKAMIAMEVRKQGRDNNIKLGSGGIREVEFIVQAVQMIRGGQDLNLQQPNIWRICQVIRDNQYLPEEVVDELRRDYDLLRRVEHALQAWQDKQTQLLPDDDSGWRRLTEVLGLTGIDETKQLIQQCRQRISDHFDRFIAADEVTEGQEYQPWIEAWQRQDLSLIPDAGLQAEIQAYINSDPVSRMQTESRERLDALFPLLLKELSAFNQPMVVWQRVQKFLDAILRRSVYMLLLREHPHALRQLLKLMSLSSWVAEILRDKPYLLDELTDQEALYSLPSLRQLNDELRAHLLRWPEDDLEQQMEVLRQFRHGRMLRAAACELTDALPLMKISDYLAHTAEAVVGQSVWTTWRQLTAKYGRPMKTREEPCNPDFIVVGYGKLGGLELNYESDLDLVYIHNAHGQLETEGPKVIDNSLFFVRLGQKLTHTLSALTSSGTLYEVDLRLRPSGGKGPLVSSLTAFEKYQLQDAWTWEHQALVRARCIAGDEELKAAFEAVRHKVLCIPRDAEKLRNEVVDMRQKMSAHLSSRAKGKDDTKVFHLKQDPGGIVDIEFMVQYGVLARACLLPELTRWTDNVRLIESLEQAGFFTKEQARQLLDAYLAYRAQGHYCMLQQKSSLLETPEDLERFNEHRLAVRTIWTTVMETGEQQPG